MKKFINLYTILGCSFLVLFIILMLLLNVDKAVIAESNEAVGLSHINNIVKYSYKENVDFMTDLLFYITFTVVIFEACLGVYQLVKRKSLFKVDIEILVFGTSLVLMVIFWLLFDYVVKINIRPTHEAEGSFPSTHVFMTTFLALASHGFICYAYENKIAKYGSLLLAVSMIALVLFGRVASGMHYITDVTGGLFLGLAFYFCTFGIIKVFKAKEE
ncbi:MAG: phosphatase PAP2 family protein [Acholeplasmatales bacterium]|nr:phosphatase PAP2 family protein [Acholeplasmatales bacterium]